MWTPFVAAPAPVPAPVPIPTPAPVANPFATNPFAAPLPPSSAQSTQWVKFNSDKPADPFSHLVAPLQTVTPTSTTTSTANTQPSTPKTATTTTTNSAQHAATTTPAPQPQTAQTVRFFSLSYCGVFLIITIGEDACSNKNHHKDNQQYRRTQQTQRAY